MQHPPSSRRIEENPAFHIKRVLQTQLRRYAETIPPDDPVWQAKYYPFNVFSERKLHEMLTYMHDNPVKAGLVERAVDWPWSPARWYGLRRSVGVPIGWVAVAD